MQLHKEAIWTRREKSGRLAVWLSERLILEQLSDLTLKYMKTHARYKYRETVPTRFKDQNILPDTGASWRYARQNSQFYYDYDRLPEERRALLPEKEQLLAMYKQQMFASQATTLEAHFREAMRLNARLYLADYAGYNEEHMNKLSEAAAVLVAAATWIGDHDIDIKRDQFFFEAADAVKKIHVQYLPTHHRRLKDKILAVLEGQSLKDAVDLPRAGNSNALRYGDNEIRSWLYQLRVSPQNYTDAYCIRKVQKLCVMTGKDTPSRSWMQTLLSANKTKWITQDRYGSGRKRNQYEGYTPIENAVFAGDCWQVDGTRWNFIPFRNDQGKEQYLYIIAVTDVYSGDLVGHHFGIGEDRYAYVQALKNACNQAGHLPWQLVLDRFPGHNTDEWELMTKRLQTRGVKVTVTSDKQGKAKVERLFGTLQTVFMQDSPYYYGEGVQSRREAAHRSPEYLKEIQKQARAEGWSFEQARAEAERIIAAYRSTPYKEYSRRYATVEESPAQLYTASDKPHTVKVEPWDFVELFGMERANTIRRGGLIKMDIMKAPYVFYIPEEHYEIIRDYRQVAVCYDIDDLSQIYLFEPSQAANRKYLGIALAQGAAQIYGPDPDYSELAKAQARARHIERQRQQERDELVNAGAEVSLLMGPHASKDSYGQAETAWIHEELEQQTTRKARVISQQPAKPLPADDDDEPLNIDIRQSY